MKEIYCKVNEAPKRTFPKMHILDPDEVRKLWQSGEAMIRNPIKKEDKMAIGMKYQNFEDCELACCICGKQDKLTIVVHRNTENKIVGYLTVCNKGCFDIVQETGLIILGNPDLA